MKMCTNNNMSYNISNFDNVIRSDGVQGTVQVSDGNLGLLGANGVTINSLGDITANAFFGYTTGGGGGGGTPSLQAVTVVGSTTNQAITISNDLTVDGNLYVSGNLVSVDVENLVVQDPIIQLANSSVSDTANTAIVFTRPTSNIAMGYRGDTDEFLLGFSTSSASGTLLTPLDDNKLNLKVYGNVEATNFVKGDATYMTNLTGASAATYGSTTQTSVITVDGTGRITGISESAIDFPEHPLQDLDSVLTEGKTTTQNITVGKVTATKEDGFIGDGELLSNTVNSTVTPGTYGTDHQVAQVTVSSDHRVSSISSVEIVETSDLDDVVNRSNTTTNVLQVGGLYSTGNVETLNYFLGNANLLSNIVNSDVGPAAYGNATHIAQITITDTGRISQVSNVKIQELSNLNQVVNRGNVTSNTVQFTNPTTALVTNLTSNVGIKLNQLANVSITNLQAEQGLLYDGSNWVNDYSVRNFTKIINKTGSTMYRGNTVYIVNSHNSNVANVALADATDPTKMPAIGLLIEDVATGSESVAVTYGKVQNVDVDGFLEGETVYVSNTAVGLVSNVKPTTNGEFIQNVGIVVKTGSNGVIFVTGVGRTNDIPNGAVTTSQADMLYVYGETEASRFAKISPQDFRSNLEQVVNTGNVTSNVVQFINPNVSLVATGNIEANYYLGNANLLSNIVNSDVGPATYGNATHIAQITITDTGRISGVSNVEIQELSNLEQVVNRGNITSNTMLLTDVQVSGNVLAPNGVRVYSGGSDTVSIGKTLAMNSQGQYAIAIGTQAGETGQLSYGLAIGYQAGQTNQVGGTLAIGNNAGNTGQQRRAIGLGYQAGRVDQDEYSIALGAFAGETDQEKSSIAIGQTAGQTTQGFNSVAIGNNAANSLQGVYSVAIGRDAARSSQGNSAIAIGRLAGETSQGFRSIAIGLQAGQSSQSDYGVAIGPRAGETSQHANTIVINAQEDVALNTTNHSAFYVKPVRILTTESNLLGYTTEGEVVDRGVLHSNLEQIVNTGNVSSNTLQVGGLTSVSNIVTSEYFLGNANLLSNTVNSDITPATYGDATNVAQITIDSNHRISSITSIAISGGGGGSSNLDQVVNLGNATSNTVIFENTVDSFVAQGTASVANIVVSSSTGSATFSSGVLTLDFENKSYKTFSITSPEALLTSIVVNNSLDGSQGTVHLYPRGTSDIDIAPNFGSSTVKSPLYSNAVINSASDCIVSVVTIGSNSFVSFSSYT